MSNQIESETLANINSRIDELERKLNIELSDDKKESICNEINQIDRNDPNFMTHKATRLIQHHNYCNNLLLERQALLLELISKTSNNSQQQVRQINCSNKNWSYADIIRTFTLAVNSIGIILATMFNLIALNKK